MVSKLEKLIMRGFDQYNQGDLDGSEASFKKALKLEKVDFNALHHLGLIEMVRGNHQAAARYIERAVNHYSKSFLAYSNLCVAYQNIGELQKSLDAGNKAVELKNSFPNAYLNRGYALMLLGRYDEAISDFDRCIKLGIKSYVPYLNKGIALLKSKRPERALAELTAAIKENDKVPEVQKSMGEALLKLGRLDEALACYDKALELKPDFVEAFHEKGNALFDLGQADVALANQNRAIELRPDYAEAYSSRGNALNKLGRLDESIASHNKAIVLKPDYAEAYSNRGLTLRELGKLDEALSDFDRAITLNGNCGHYNRAWSLLQRGDFKNGLVEYEWRSQKSSNFGIEKCTDIQALVGKRVLVGYELYFGDTIQFCRYAKMLLAIGANVTIAPQKRIAGLISSLDERLNIVDPDSIETGYDFYVPMMSLPFIFKTELHTIPREVPYLFVEEALQRKWQRRLVGEAFKVAVVWKGSDSLAGRSFPLRQLIGISKIPGIQLVSLQKGEGVEEIAPLSKELRIEDFGDELDDGEHGFLDTAAIMKCCDLVIACDTAAAHLAGALGVSVWVALRQYPEWRWLLDRADSPWYPTMRLFRQKNDGDWNNVFREMERMLLEEMLR